MRHSCKKVLSAVFIGCLIAVVVLVIDISRNAPSSDLYVQTGLHRAAQAGDEKTVRQLLSRGANVHAEWSLSHATPLHLAGNAKAAEVLLEYGADVTDRDSEGKTPLHWASQDGRLETAQFLLSRGAPVDAVDNMGGGTALHVASTAPMISLLISKGANVMARDKGGGTPLHYARTVEIARLLISHGADVTPQGADTTPLLSAIWNYRFDIVKVLIDHGADVRAKDSAGRAPMHVVVQHLLNCKRDQQPDVNSSRNPYRDESELKKLAQLLISRGADPNAEDNRGATPLSAAIVGKGKSVDLVKFLIANGADPRVTNRAGGTPLNAALEIAYEDKNGTNEIPRLLIENGANVNICSGFPRGWTPLHWASSHSDSEMVRLLISKGANVNARDAEGRTPLHEIAGLEVTKILLTHGANPNAIDRKGNTPLHAVLLGSTHATRPKTKRSTMGKMLELLLASGAHPGIKNSYGRTPLGEAEVGGYQLPVECLRNYRKRQYSRNRLAQIA